VEGGEAWTLTFLLSIQNTRLTEPMRLRKFPYVFLAQSISLARGNMDVSTKFGSAHGCAVRTGALKRDLFSKIKKRPGRHSFGYFSFAVERKVTRRQGRNTNK
jgi:hypothetical protein